MEELEMYKKALEDWENPKGLNGKENHTDDGFCSYFETVFEIKVPNDKKFKKKLPALFNQKAETVGDYHYPQEHYRTNKW